MKALFRKRLYLQYFYLFIRDALKASPARQLQIKTF